MLTASVNELTAVAVCEHLAIVEFRAITVNGELVEMWLSLDRTSSLREGDDKRKYGARVRSHLGIGRRDPATHVRLSFWARSLR